MKKTLFIVLAIVISLNIFGQSPEKMSYQAVIRNNENELVINQEIGMQISILQSTPDGIAVYSETQTPETNTNGLISIEIGNGLSSDDFASIDWSNGPFFIKTEVDPTGGDTYTITGTSQVFSVPYAFYAKTAETVENITIDYSEIENTPDLSNYDNNVNDDFSGDYNDLENTPEIPTIPENVSAFSNDAGYLTSYSETDPQFNNWDKDYNDLINTPIIPTVPTNVSEFTNDAGYLTSFIELDGDNTNEIQDISLTGTNLSITNGSTINLSSIDTDTKLSEAEVDAFVNNNGYLTSFTEIDGSNTNELQDISLSGNNLSITNGSTIDLSSIDTNTQLSEAEVDAMVIDNGYITNEFDPVYSSSHAANITAADITNLNNLSGTNTGDQDISGIANNTTAITENIQAIQDTASQIRANMPSIKTYEVGDFSLGGVVFYVDETGQHGLICAIHDINDSERVQWYNDAYTYTSASGDGIYAGEMNTMLIIANQGHNPDNYAAGLCSRYEYYSNGKRYGDWYLPSKSELQIMCNNKDIINASATVFSDGASFDESITGYYWSSTEVAGDAGLNSAAAQNFDTGTSYYTSKFINARIRPIRRF